MRTPRFYSTVAPLSMITRAAASQYHLELHSAPQGLYVEGIGGSVDVSRTSIEDLQLQNWKFSHIEFLVGGSSPGTVGLIRCWARALLGTDLDKALNDCNAALRMNKKSAEFLVVRAVVLLRLGRYDSSIEDFDASLALQPRNAWALYGRGIGRLRKGMNVEGRADISAATEFLPTIAEQASMHGIAP